MLEIMKLDDQIYIEEGFRKEQIDKAITQYDIDERAIGRQGQELSAAGMYAQAAKLNAS